MLQGFRVDFRGPRGGFIKDIRVADRFTVYLPNQRLEVYLGSIKNFEPYNELPGFQKFKIIIRDENGKQVTLKQAQNQLAKYEKAFKNQKRKIHLYRVFLVIPKGTKTLTIPFKIPKTKSGKKSKRKTSAKQRQNQVLKFLKEATFSVDVRTPPKQPKKKLPKQVFPDYKLKFKEEVVRKIIKSKEDDQYRGIEKHYFDLTNSLEFVKEKKIREDLTAVFFREMKAKLKKIYKEKGRTDYFMKINYEGKDMPLTPKMRKKNQQFTGFALPRLQRSDVDSWSFLEDQVDQVQEQLEQSLKGYLRNNMAGLFFIKGFQIETTQDEKMGKPNFKVDQSDYDQVQDAEELEQIEYKEKKKKKKKKTSKRAKVRGR